MQKQTPFSCDWLFQQLPSAPFSRLHPSAALIEADRLQSGRFGKRSRFREVDFDDQEPGCQEALGWILAWPPPFAADDERLALRTQAVRRFRVDMLKGE